MLKSNSLMNLHCNGVRSIRRSHPPLFLCPSHNSRSPKVTSLSKLRFNNPRNPLPVLSCSSPEEFLQIVADSGESTLPCVRTFENDLARLSLVGAVSSEQAITAAAADGGRVAAEHIDSGVPAMVAETVFPGPVDEHATISTRLFLPARKVQEKARKLRKSFSKDIMSSMTSTNILAMTFRQVVLQQLWSFELVLFRPGTERNMKVLENSREVPASLSLSSSDERAISVLSEAVCSCALRSTERNFHDDMSIKNSINVFTWFRKSKTIASKDSSVIIHPLFEDEIVENAKKLLESFNKTDEKLRPVKRKPKNPWWTPSVQSKLEKIGGTDFSAWISEYIPAYRVQIDASKLKDLKVKGWNKAAENRWEVILTHSQMVELASIVDMYYEDLYSLPNKQLSYDVVGKFTNLSSKKRNVSFMNILSITLVSGIFLVAISALGQIFLPYLRKGQNFPINFRSLPSSENKHAVHQSSDATKLEAICISVVERIKDAFAWPGDVMWQLNVGAWIGEVPHHLKLMCEDTSGEENSTDSAFKETLDSEIKSLAQDIATYQVVLSTDGKVIGFQPTSRVGVNHWASNPLAKELYGGRKLSPGFIEGGLSIPLPSEVVVIELLMSVTSDARFALARPVQ
ncbi:hypothetical protein HS088_TW21G01291 [Tripterygium wilfordii]|uniref:Uncharacterized protein n=1 Tax=Tripterygium wilfordii TaxID=458696 RepID=A0A7J7C4T1_TRIWF|nr:uncharacterized protein LOC119989122 [Tripterygium wilfordii]KAF5729133.1 hypothetical protein HS088_TW21G01291 [Tripterygium wilfordii]